MSYTGGHLLTSVSLESKGHSALTEKLHPTALFWIVLGS